MLKLLLFRGDRNDADSSAYLFVSQLNAAAQDTVAATVRYSDLVFSITDGVAMIEVASTGERIEDLAETYYVRDYHGYQSERYAIAKYLARAGKKVFNTDTLDNESLSKLEQLVALTAAGISVPNARFASDPRLLLPPHYPCVAKSITASNNRLNFLVGSESDYSHAITEIGSKVLVQDYVENDGDYKVIIALGRPVAVYKREWSNRYMSGDKPTRKIVQEDDVAALAALAAQALGREFCGVDIVRDATSGKLYVLECNFNAGLRLAGIDNDEALFAKTLKLLLEL